MRFGFSLPVQHPVGDDMTQRFAELLEMVRLARGAGFHHLSASQHYLAAPFQYMQPLPVLARVAAEIGEMTLGTGIMLLALQHPVDVAESLATPGRDLRRAAGVRRGTRIPRRRVRCLRDSARPPIVVGASNDKMVRRVARIGDAWAIAGHATLATLERQVALYRAALEAEGKPFPPPPFSLSKELYIARDMDTALREALPYLATKYETYAQWGQDNVLPTGETFRLPIEQLRQDRFIVGDPAYCIEQIAWHQERLDIQQMGFRLHWPGLPHQRVMQAIELLGERVLPHFA